MKMNNQIDIGELIKECIGICEKIERLPMQKNPSDAEKEISSLKNKWEYVSKVIQTTETYKDVSQRYAHAIEKAETIMMNNQPISINQKKDSIERLEKIACDIESISNSTDITDTDKTYYSLINEWEDICKSQKSPDENLNKRFWEACEKYQKNREWILWANLKKKEDICSQLKQLEESKEDQNLVDKFSELRSLWKETGPIPANKIRETGKNYRSLCEAIYEKCLVVFKEKEQEKEKNLRLKESLCEEVENLIEPVNWKQATEFVQKIQKNWDAFGPIPKESSEIVWERFRNACAVFFEKRKLFYQERKKTLKENTQKKKELCDKIEAIKDSTDWKETSKKIKELQKEWQDIGPSIRAQEETLWKRFRTACDNFFNSQKSYFENLEKDKPQNLIKKEDLCRRVESLGDISDDEKYKKIIELQADWKQIGPVPKEREDEIWKRFRKPIDEYFENKKTRTEEEKQTREKNQKAKEQLCVEAENLCNSTNWRETAEKIKGLQKQWKEIGPTQREIENSLWHRFHTACETFFSKLKDHNSKQKEETDEKLKEKIDICFRAEIISGVDVSKSEEEERAEWQLKKLSENFWFRVIDEDDNNHDSKAQKLKELQKLWKDIGPIPTDTDRILWRRFQRACNFFFSRKSEQK
jgi:hypothetical protein